MSNHNYYPPGQDLTFRMTSLEEEQELFRKAHLGDETAKDFLVRNHLLWAMLRAQELVKGDLPKNEIVSAANMAIMEAFDRFDPSRGVRFTAFLRPFIRGQVALLWRSKFSGSGPDPSISRSPNSHPAEDRGEEKVPEELTVDHESEKRDQQEYNRQELEKALAALPGKDRELIRLIQLENYNLAEVARSRGVTRAAVHCNYMAILKKLRKSLRKTEVALS